uniref:DUF7507 domain-containing protein n=2 Tax=uncultured Dokdonia sp. TaxID=575653 RepID=UPI0026259C0D
VMDDMATTDEDTPVNIDVLDNDDFDPNSDVEVTDVTNPANGTVTINPDGTVDYTPDPDFCGTDTFDYTVTITNADGSTATETATVTIEVACADDVMDDMATTDEDTPVNIDVLDNDDFDPNSDVEVTDVTDPANGTVTINPDGTVDYTPDPDFCGTDTFDYTVTITNADGSTTTETATVTIEVACADDVMDDMATTDEDTPVNIDVLDNDDFDPNSDVEVTDVTDPANGTVTINPDGTVDYTPDPDFCGTDTFDYTVTITNADGSTTTETATVTIEVICVNEAIEITKTSTYDPVTGIITYTYTVENTGDVTVFDIEVVEDAGAFTGTGVLPVPVYEMGGTDEDGEGDAFDLLPGESLTFTADYVVTQADIDAGVIENQAGAIGFEENGSPVEDTASDDGDDTDGNTDDDVTVTDVSEAPDGNIDLEKIAEVIDTNGNGIIDAGDEILYTFIVTNNGNVDLTGITITDNNVTVVGGPIDLAVGESDSTTFTAIYVITQDDVEEGGVINTAIAEGTDPDGTIITDTSDDPEDSTNTDTDNDGDFEDPTITIIPQLPSIELIKVGVFVDINANGFADVGDQIQYTFTVTNTGNVIIEGVTVTDNNVTVIGDPVDLLPGESADFTAIYIITEDDIEAGEVVNTATAIGLDRGGDVVTDVSDDPTDTTDTDVEGDGDADDPTVTILDTEEPGVEEIVVHNGISLGEDGQNDTFIISGIENFPDNTVKIFNRWGVLVYEADGYGQNGNQFRGLSNGRATISQDKFLPVGTYYWTLEYVDNSGQTRTSAGYLYIQR